MTKESGETGLLVRAFFGVLTFAVGIASGVGLALASWIALAGDLGIEWETDLMFAVGLGICFLFGPLAIWASRRFQVGVAWPLASALGTFVVLFLLGYLLWATAD